MVLATADEGYQDLARTRLHSGSMRKEPCFVGTSVTVGIFRCRRTIPRSRTRGRPSITASSFPARRSGSSTRVSPHSSPILHVVTFYNPGQEYRRRVLDGRGDACEWFAVHPDVLREMTSAIDPRAADREACGFDHSHCLSDAWSYVEQRRIFRHVTNEAPDPLLVEETALRILWRLLSGAKDVPPLPPARGAVELSEAVRSVLARSFADRLTLGELARSLDTSVFHLCRAFRAVTGTDHPRVLEPVASARLTRTAARWHHATHRHRAGARLLEPLALQQCLSRGAGDDALGRAQGPARPQHHGSLTRTDWPVEDENVHLPLAPPGSEGSRVQTFRRPFRRASGRRNAESPCGSSRPRSRRARARRVNARLSTQWVHREAAALIHGQRAARPFDEKLTERVARIGIT